MADRSFEQQVKDELSSLRMKPDDTVWLEVEASLRKEKKRRWLIWFFLFAGCAGASIFGYYYFYQNNIKEEFAKTKEIKSLTKEETKKDQVQKNELTAAKEIATNGSSEMIGKDRIVLHDKTKENDQKISKRFRDGQHSFKAIGKNQVTGRVEKNENNTTNQSVLAENATVVNKMDKTDKSQDHLSSEKNVILDCTESKTNDIDKNSVIPKTTFSENTPIVKNEEKVAELQATVKETPATNDQTITVNKKDKKNRWQWRIAAEAGTGGLRNTFSLSVARDYSYSAALSTPGSGNPGQATNNAPVIKDAFSYGIHIEANKQVNKKHRIGISAGYSLFQTYTNAGKRIDSAFSSSSAAWGLTSGIYSGYYYTPGDTIRYTNKYHFLQLGADLFTPFKLFRKISLEWQLGTGINILAATNGLHYDPSTGKLFSNNALYAKVQSYVSTGINFSIGKGPFLYIGPHWQYNFTKLTGQTGATQHLLLSSVKVSFVLPKKKK